MIHSNTCISLFLFRHQPSGSSSESDFSSDQDRSNDGRKKKQKKRASSQSSSDDPPSMSSDSESDNEQQDSSSTNMDTYELLRTLWPRDKRPTGLKKREEVNKHSVETLLSK